MKLYACFLLCVSILSSLIVHLTCVCTQLSYQLSVINLIVIRTHAQILGISIKHILKTRQVASLVTYPTKGVKELMKDGGQALLPAGLLFRYPT